jgi:hypothetical protein
VRQRVADALRSAGGAAPVHRVQPVTLHHIAAFGTDWMRTPIDFIRRAMRS